MQRLHPACIVAVAAAVLAGCGGGGGPPGSGGFTPPTDNFDLSVGWRNVLTTTRTWTVSGVASDGKTYSLSVATAPGASSVFPVTGTTTSRTDVSVDLSQGGSTVSSGLNQTFFDSSAYTVIGTRDSVTAGATACSVATAASVPPAAVMVGSSGALDTLDELDGCLPTSTKVGTSTSTWSLEFESGITYFCLNATVRDLTGTVAATESDCLQVSPDGTLGAKARISISQGGFTLVARS